MRTTVMNALIHPIHILTLLIAVVSGLIAAWWLFPLGLLVWFGMVLRYVYDPVEQFRQKMDDRQPLASRFEVPFRQIERVQVQMFNAISPASPGTRRTLQPILDSMGTLVQEVYQLCQRMTPVENYRLVSEPVSALQLQLKQLNDQVEKATDPIAKKAYEEAREALTLRIDQQNRTIAQLNRVDAYLSGLVNELNALLGQIIPLQSMQGELMQQKTPTVVSQIQQEISEVRAFSQV